MRTSSSAESCSCEKWEAGSWGLGQCGNPEEEESCHWKPLPSNGQRRLRRLYTCCSYSDFRNV
jgi:hypothetical protein